MGGDSSLYVYVWNDSITQKDRNGLSAGVYTVTIYDGGNCGTIKTYVITQPLAISPLATIMNSSCFGSNNASIALSTTGGVGNYLYSWSNGVAIDSIAPLAAGTYSVTITDSNSCTITRSYTISEPTALQASGTTQNVSCSGGSNGTITQTVTGGTSTNGTYSYQWTGGNTQQDRTGLAAGTYSVTITDSNSCTITRSYTISEPTALQASGTTQNVSCSGGSNGTITQTVTGGTANQWQPIAINVTGGNNTSKDRTGLASRHL
jgi:hypothetical protein